GAVPDALRRQLAEERAGGRGGGGAGAGAGGRERRRVGWAARSTGPVGRRVHPDEHASGASGGGGAAVAGDRARRVPQALRRAVLRRLRAVLPGGALPGRARGAAPEGVGGELVLPALPLPRAAARTDRERRAGDRAGRAAERGAGVPEGRAGGQ